MEANNEGNAEYEKYRAVCHKPHPFIVIQMSLHLHQDHRGEDGHDHPLCVADMEKVFDIITTFLEGWAASLRTRTVFVNLRLHRPESFGI